MKLEQSTLMYNGGSSDSGYIDLARNLSAVNGKSITQTKRRKGKYRPLNYLVRVRAIVGSIVVQTLNGGYPTRNAIVKLGVTRDAMLKSAGIQRSNLETYQEELRVVMDSSMDATSSQYYPGATDKGTGSGGWGESLTYDYTRLVIADPDTARTEISHVCAVLGTQAASSDDWDDDSHWFAIDNWLKWRHSFTPSASGDDIANNVFSWATQQSDTAEKIIDMIDDSQDEKPYELSDFTTQSMSTAIGIAVGNPVSTLLSVPLGLLKVTHLATAAWEIEVVGVAEL